MAEQGLLGRTHVRIHVVQSLQGDPRRGSHNDGGVVALPADGHVLVGAPDPLDLLVAGDALGVRALGRAGSARVDRALEGREPAVVAEAGPCVEVAEARLNSLAASLQAEVVVKQRKR